MYIVVLVTAKDAKEAQKIADGLLQDKLIAHTAYIEMHGEDMPEILDWKWSLGLRP